MSQYPLIPYDRVRDHFQDQLHIPVSAGSVFNFNVDSGKPDGKTPVVVKENGATDLTAGEKKMLKRAVQAELEARRGKR